MAGIIGQENQIGPTVLSAGKRVPGQKRNCLNRQKDRKVKRPDTKPAAQNEPPYIYFFCFIDFAPKLPTDKKTAKDKEEIDPGPANPAAR